MQKHFQWTGLLAMTLAGVLAAGCSSTPSTPQGSHGGRLDDSYRTTGSDEASTKASIPALLEFADLTAQSLAEQISSLPHVVQRYDAVTKTQGRLILEMGSIDNQSRTPSSDFELIQRRLRSQLMRSQLIKSKFMFVEGRARAERDVNRIQGNNNGDLLQEGNAGATDQYANNDTYLLLGDFLEANRGNRRQYFFNFKLVHAQSREIVFDEAFDLAQMTKH